jgi:hypothetical protein
MRQKKTTTNPADSAPSTVERVRGASIARAFSTFNVQRATLNIQRKSA